ncbi:MAG: cation diffusion facilitator family transporter [Chitinophagaceae bacterium]
MAKSYKSIYSALLANLLIAVTKFIAGAFTNSGSMISEGVHSVVDTANELLLLYGLHRSKKPPDSRRPFGYGKELYFWSFIVSILIFALGGGISIYTGVLHAVHPEPLRDPAWNYIVLALSIVFEGVSLRIAVKEFNKVRGTDSWWKAIINSKDPASFLILFEDGAAVLGLLIVGVLMVAAHVFQVPVLDGVASVLVGLLLVFASVILARESRSLLMGEGIAPATQQKITQLTEADPDVEKLVTIMSTYQSPEDILLMLLVDFRQDLDTAAITEAIERIRDKIKSEFLLVRYVIIQPGAVIK